MKNQTEMTLFSPMEQKIINIVKVKPLSITDIVDRYYTDDEPNNPRNVVANAIKKINKKCEYHRLPWFLNGSGKGRGGRRVWLDKLLKPSTSPK